MLIVMQMVILYLKYKIQQRENLKTGAWCYYNNNPENRLKFGKIYNCVQ